MQATAEALTQRGHELRASQSWMHEADEEIRRKIDSLLSTGNSFSSAKTDLMAPYLYSTLKTSRKTEELERALLNPSLLRAAGLRQVGILTNPMDLKDFNQEGENGSVKQRLSHHPELHMFDHRRITHMLAVGLDMYLAANQLGYPIEEQSRAAAAGLQHDLGHAALSHVGDVVLDELLRKSHEERSIEGIDKTYQPLLNYVSHYGPYNMFGTQVTWEGIESFLPPQKEIILEKPGLGQILTLIDTNAYLQIDMQEAGLDLGQKSILPTIGRNIKLDESGQLIVDEAGKEAITDLLNVRREAYGRLYNHPFSLVAEEMHIKGIKRLIKLGVIGIADLKDGTDDFVYGALLNHSRHDPISANLLSGFHQGMGIPGSQGQYAPIDSIPLTKLVGKTNIPEIEHRVGENLGLPEEDYVVVIPPDLGGKTVRVINQKTHSEEALKATDTRVYHPLQGQVIACCRPDIAKKIKQKEQGFLFK